jgi:hypothetical protein
MDFFVNAIGDVFAWVLLIGAALAAALALGGVLFLLVDALTARDLFPFGVAMLLLAVEAVLLALFGLAGDYIQRIYRQSSGRPFYLVRRVHEASHAK